MGPLPPCFFKFRSQKPLLFVPPGSYQSGRWKKREGPGVLRHLLLSSLLRQSSPYLSSYPSPVPADSQSVGYRQTDRQTDRQTNGPFLISSSLVPSLFDTFAYNGPRQRGELSTGWQLLALRECGCRPSSFDRGSGLLEHRR